MKRALILAAGMGKRLGNLTKDIPKCLLVVEPESRRTLLDFSLSALSDTGVNEIIIVTGFAEKTLKKHVSTNWSDKFSVQYIFNDKYADYNNIYSAYLAKDSWDDETILLNSDIVFHPDILKMLKSVIARSAATKQSNNGSRNEIASSALSEPPRNDSKAKSYLVIDDANKLDPEDMKVKVNEKGEIKEINKKLDCATSLGEYIGITYLRGNERVKFLESLCINVKNKNFDLYYEDALAHVLKDISVYPLSTEGKLWTEVDTEEDYNLAKEIANQIGKVAMI